MVAYLALVHKATSKLKGLSITQISREENMRVDRLARLTSSLDADLQGVRVEYFSKPSIHQPKGMDVDPVDVEPSWMDPILMHLTTGNLPKKKNEAKHVRFRAARYHVINGVLYKRGYSIPYLQCIHPAQVMGILQEIHEGVCCSHIGGRSLFRIALL